MPNPFEKRFNKICSNQTKQARKFVFNVYALIICLFFKTLDLSCCMLFFWDTYVNQHTVIDALITWLRNLDKWWHCWSIFVFCYAVINPKIWLCAFLWYHKFSGIFVCRNFCVALNLWAIFVPPIPVVCSDY